MGKDTEEALEEQEEREEEGEEQEDEEEEAAPPPAALAEELEGLLAGEDLHEDVRAYLIREGCLDLRQFCGWVEAGEEWEALLQGERLAALQPRHRAFVRDRWERARQRRGEEGSNGPPEPMHGKDTPAQDTCLAAEVRDLEVAADRSTMRVWKSDEADKHRAKLEVLKRARARVTFTPTITLIYTAVILYSCGKSLFDGHVTKLQGRMMRESTAFTAWTTCLQAIGALGIGVLLDARGARPTCLACFASTATLHGLVLGLASRLAISLTRPLMFFSHPHLIMQALLSQVTADGDRAGALGLAFLLHKLLGDYGKKALMELAQLRQVMGPGAIAATTTMFSVASIVLSLRMPASPPAMAMAQASSTVTPAATVIGKEQLEASSLAPRRKRGPDAQLAFISSEAPLPVPAPCSAASSGLSKLFVVALRPMISWLLLVHLLLAVGPQLKGADREASMRKTFKHRAPVLMDLEKRFWNLGAIVGILLLRPLCQRFTAIKVVQALVVYRICQDLIAMTITVCHTDACRELQLHFYGFLAGFGVALIRTILYVVTTSAVRDHERGTVLAFTHALEFLVMRLAPPAAAVLRQVRGHQALRAVSVLMSCIVLFLLRRSVVPRYVAKDGFFYSHVASKAT